MATSADLTTGLTAIFGSAPTAAELATFQSICDTSGIDAAFQSAVDASGADSARTVISFYQVFYGRQPDAGGLAFWTEQVESGAVSLNDLADEFATASEFDARFGDRTPTEIVFAQYENVLGRQPDFEGLTFWSDQVSSGNLSLADLGRFFATSNEAEARFDPFVDALLLDLADGGSTDDDASLFEVDISGGVTGPTTGEPIDLAGLTGRVDGTAGSDLFTAETGDIGSSSNINGGSGADTLTVFNDGQGNAVSPRMTGVETVVWTEQTNDLNSSADNNVGGYSNGRTTEVDVELDAGRIVGVTRWEDYDSRADLVIEDARDDTPEDGTFTGDIEIAMVSTDPGNVDYAIYFDQPVNTATNNDSIFIEVIDQNNSNTFSSASVDNATPGSLEDARLDEFSFILNGERVDIVLDRSDPDIGTAFFGEDATYTDLLNAINGALDNATLADGTAVSSLVTADFGGTFFENIGNDNDSAGANSQVFGRQIVINGNTGVSLEDAGPGDFRVTQLGEPADIAASVRAQNVVNEELIRLNIDLDDVGKGSMGGDLLAGAMSTGRQSRDDGTSDSLGIQQFDIEVDRSSQLQTINSTNNSLEVVNIVNGENNGPNNTTAAVDEQIGDLVVRGRANPDVGAATDGAMPGAAPQHDDFGFNDVRVINAAAMIGSVDLTLDLSNEIVQKYLTLDDTSSAGNRDDIAFNYDLGTNDDEFFINASDSALIDAGTASREDFNLRVNGNSGDDTIVTNVGNADKRIDGQGQDYYLMDVSDGAGWYANQANNDAAGIRVSGGNGNDSIWTHGWGDATITGGSGQDVVYTDNSGTLNLPGILGNIGRNIDEHEQIDYQVGAVWTFNDDNGDDGGINNIAGSTNDLIAVALPDANRNAGTFYETKVTVSFFGADGDDDTAYTATVSIPDAVIDSDGQITDQVLNQAIKDAVNNDAVLNKVLEAVDGPGQSMAVYSKIDGDFVTTDLAISVFEEQTSGGTLTTVPVDLDGSSYDTSGASDTSDFRNFGSASDAESDNRIIITADNTDDVTVLSTNDDDDDGGNEGDGRNLNGDSNETLIIENGAFGVETIFNFGADDVDDGDIDGEDRFSFEAIDYDGDFTNGGVNLSDDSISIITENGTNNTASEVADLFDGATDTGTTNHIVIVYDDNSNTTDDTLEDSANNTGRVFLVTDGSGAASANLLGEIELIGTDWSTLDTDNFI